MGRKEKPQQEVEQSQSLQLYWSDLLLFIYQQMIMQSQIIGELSYAPNGLNKIRQSFLRPPILPDFVRTPQPLLQFFHDSKLKYPLVQSTTSRYNITQLIRWVIDDIRELNPSVFQMEGSSLNIVLCILNMMEINQINKALDSRQGKDADEEVGGLIRDMLEQAIQNCSACGNKINDNKCTMISENTSKSRDILLIRRKQVVEDCRILNTPLMELDLSCAFCNILLNLRRTIRGKLLERQAELRDYIRALKLLEVKLYYLSLSTFSLTEPYVRQLAHDVFNNERKITYVHLIHQQRGIFKIHRYLQEAPISQLEKDMDLLSQRFNERFQSSRRQQNPRNQ